MYFAWGETIGYTREQVENREHSFSDKVYNAGPAASISADLTLEQDAAHVNLGGNWRMPTEAECQELIDNCDVTWISSYKGKGVAGRLYTSRVNGKSVFFPAAGCGYYSSVDDVGTNGDYCSTSWKSSGYATSFYYNTSDSSRDTGRSVRGVCE